MPGFAITVEFLQGVYAAADPLSAGRRPEWPPHPARVFGALVCAHKAGAPSPEDAARERAALEFLEGLVPGIEAGEAAAATPVARYGRMQAVGPAAADKAGYLPEARLRAEFHTPEAYPERASVRFVYDADAGEHLAALAAVARRVPCLGRSESVVLMDAESLADAPAPDWVPADRGEKVRVPYPGCLAEMERAHAAGERHNAARVVAYGRPSAAAQVPARPEFGPSMTFALSRGGTMDPALWPAVQQALRSELLARLQALHGPGALPPALSGHEADGTPAARPHMAVLPMLRVGHPNLDGRIDGFTVLLPADLAPDSPEVALAARALVGLDAVRFPPGSLDVRPVNEAADGVPASLRWSRFASGAKFRTWTTVTPHVFDGAPRRRNTPEGALRERERLIRKSLRRAGLPDPVRIRMREASWVPGAPGVAAHLADAFLRYGTARAARHLLVEFAEPVAGPVLFGYDIHRGFGLCLPHRGGEAG